MQVRVRVWPRLLGMNMLETVMVLPGEEELSSHPEYNQGKLEVFILKRVLIYPLFSRARCQQKSERFPPSIDEAERPLLKDQLTRLVVRVLMAQHYYQGHHDMVITFLLVVGGHIGYQSMESCQ